MKKSIIIFILMAFLLEGCTAAVKTEPVSKPGKIIIKNVTVVDVEKETQMEGILEGCNIVIEGDTIRSCSTGTVKEEEGDIVIDGTEMVALPGFVNTHTHLWQHVAKGFYPGGDLQEWIRIYSAAHYIQEEELYELMLAACSQALLSGITSVSDFASVNFREFSLDAVCRAIRDSRLEGKVVYWYPAAFIPDQIKKKEIKRMRKTYKNHLDIWMGQGPLSFYSLPSVYAGILLAKGLKIRISEHTMENVKEQQDFYDKLKEYMETYGDKLEPEDAEILEKMLQKGKPEFAPIQQFYRMSRQLVKLYECSLQMPPEFRKKLLDLMDYNCFSQMPALEMMDALKNYVSVHSVWLTPCDMRIAKEHNVYISHNPESNMYLSSGIAPILEYKQHGIPVTLATDGAASNDGINFFSAMRAMWNLQKILYLDSNVAKEIDAWYVLKAATINGAEALGLDKNKTGSIAADKEADIILLSKKRLGMAPYVPDKKNLASLIVYAADTRDVDTVLSDGKIVVQGGKLVPFMARGKEYTEALLAERLEQISRTVVKRASEGKVIEKKFKLKPGGGGEPYWYQYYSVRKKDCFDVSFRNTGSEAVDVRIAMSGTVFGGTSAAMMSEEAKERFPDSPLENYYDRTFTLAPSEVLRVEKIAGKYHYTFSSSDATKTYEDHNSKTKFKPKSKSEKFRGEQMLFLVNQRVTVDIEERKVN